MACGGALKEFPTGKTADDLVCPPAMRNGPIRIPSDEECRQLMADMGMLEHIVAHSRQVCRVALFLSDHAGLPCLDRELIRAAALLHDITKTRSFQTQEPHAETGARLLTELGYPEVARVVGQHVRLASCRPAGRPTAAQIVNYADKRVLHDRIVPLHDRMAYILERYGLNLERKRYLLSLWRKTERLEGRLFAPLPFAPDDLSRLLPEA